MEPSALTMNDPIVEFEQRTQPFLEAAFTSMGVGSGQAEQLSQCFRDVNDDLVGVGPVLIGLAGQMGVPPGEWSDGPAPCPTVRSTTSQSSCSGWTMRASACGSRQRPPGEGRDLETPWALDWTRKRWASCLPSCGGPIRMVPGHSTATGRERGDLLKRLSRPAPATPRPPPPSR